MVISVGHVFNRSSGTDLVSDALVEDKERVGGLDILLCGVMNMIWKYKSCKGCRVVLATKLQP